MPYGFYMAFGFIGLRPFGVAYNCRDTWQGLSEIDNSDIDWNKSINEIDKQLYVKYNLSLEEIDMIESKIKHMD